MPCRSEPPSDWEIQRRELNRFLDECGHHFDKKPAVYWGYACREMSNDAMAAWLCEWCQAHDVREKSLELQIWWRDHQAFDAKRKAEEAAVIKRQRLKQQAIAKLTVEERLALGVD